MRISIPTPVLTLLTLVILSFTTVVQIITQNHLISAQQKTSCALGMHCWKLDGWIADKMNEGFDVFGFRCEWCGQEEGFTVNTIPRHLWNQVQEKTGCGPLDRDDLPENWKKDL